MSALFNHAIRHEWTERNPIRFVRQSAKRERAPDVLTAEEFKALLAELDGPYYVMVLLAAVTGLRVSELIAVKWEDVDFAAGEIRLTRAIVCQQGQHIGPLKTETSQKRELSVRLRKNGAGLFIDGAVGESVRTGVTLQHQ